MNTLYDMNTQELIVGLETHISLKSRNKLFCYCESNKQFCSICRGLPGSIPSTVSNQAIESAKLLCKYLKCEVTSDLEFYRKHYYYYDLPNGFQRTQLPSKPFAINGALKLRLLDKEIPLAYCYLEQDPAGTQKYDIDYTRCGNPLLEVVTKPCFTGDLLKVQREVTLYLRTLERLSKDLRISIKDLKTDVNVSLKANPKLRFEIKNVTSLSAIRNALKQAVLLLKSNQYSRPMTFHYKLKLRPSRLKSSYLFSMEHNIPKIPIRPNDSHADSKIITLYQVLDLVHDRFDTKTYDKKFIASYCKLLYQYMSENNDTKDILDTTDMKQSYMMLKSSKVLEVKDVLVQKIKSYWSDKVIRSMDYNTKSSSYLKLLNQFKNILVNQMIPFNSNYLNKLLNQYFNS
jgi:Asp-tRNA(Asn)/Glu-tRNA(Gln) amidotransferase B subunit